MENFFLLGNKIPKSEFITEPELGCSKIDLNEFLS